MCIPSEARGSFKERTVFKRIVLQIFLFLVMAPSSSEPSIQGATLFACVAAPTKLADITIPSNLPAFLDHLACGSLQRQTVFKRIDRQIFLFLVMAPSNRYRAHRCLRALQLQPKGLISRYRVMYRFLGFNLARGSLQQHTFLKRIVLQVFLLLVSPCDEIWAFRLRLLVVLGQNLPRSLGCRRIEPLSPCLMTALISHLWNS